MNEKKKLLILGCAILMTILIVIGGMFLIRNMLNDGVGVDSVENTTETTSTLETTTEKAPKETTSITIETKPKETINETTKETDGNNENVNHKHEYKETRIAKPTCTGEGYTVMTCSCGKSYKSNKTAAIGHKYTDKVVAPTTSERGYTLHTCKNCGSSYKDSYTNKLPINPTNPSNPTEPKPTEPQKPTHKHRYTKTVVSPTCTENGYTKHTCSGCGNVYNDNYVDALGHNYTEKVVKANCIEDGYTEHKCVKCKHTYKDNIVKASHQYKETVVESTCDKDGYTEHKCGVCGHSYKDNIVKGEHKYKDTVVKPTCENQGYTEHKCEKCGDVKKDNFTEKIPHNFVDVYVEPTCNKPGMRGKRCEWCQKTDSIFPIMPDPSKHEFVLVEEKEPTCVDYGKKIYKCSVCDEENIVQTTPPTTQHNYKTSVVQPTCLLAGYEKHVCSVCGDHYEIPRDDLQALGHNYVKVGTSATCTQPGFATMECIRCKNQDTEFEEALGHGDTHEEIIDNMVCTVCNRCGETLSYKPIEIPSQSVTPSVPEITLQIEKIEPSNKEENVQKMRKVEKMDWRSIEHVNKICPIKETTN